MSPRSEAMQKGREKSKTVPLYLEEDIRPEMKEDIYDPSYQDEEGPPPKLQYVWRNIILMALLHLGALYGITLIPSCKVYTCLFGEQLPLSWASVLVSPFSLMRSTLSQVSSHVLYGSLHPFFFGS